MSSIQAHHLQEPFAAVTGPHSVRVHTFANSLLRIGIREILDAASFVVSDSSPEGTPQLPACDSSEAELFIIDEKFSGGPITELIVKLKARHPTARVIVLADHFDLNTVRSTQKAGADGFCLMSSNADVLIRSIELVMLGEAVVPTDLILAMMKNDTQGTEHRDASDLRKPSSEVSHKLLSNREIEVLHWLKAGAPNKVIANNLSLAEATVKVHVKRILRKIGAINRAQAAIWAAHHLPADPSLQ